jgi:hypothetical protein
MFNIRKRWGHGRIHKFIIIRKMWKSWDNYTLLLGEHYLGRWESKKNL